MEFGSLNIFALEEIEQFEVPPGERYFRFAARETTLVRDEIWMSWLVTHGTKRFISVPNRNIYDYYLHEDTALATLQRLGKFIEKDFEGHLARYEPYKKRAIENAERLTELVAEGADAEILTQAHAAVARSQWELSEWVWGAWSVIHFYEPELMERLGTREGIESVGALEEPIEFLKARRDLFRLSAAEWTRTYGWLNIYSPPDPPFTEEDFERMRKETSKDEIEQEFANFAKVREEFKTFLSGISGERERLISRIVHAYAFLKSDRIDTWRRVLYATLPFYEYLAKLLGNEAGLGEASSLSIEEMYAILRGEKPASAALDKLRLRAQNRALYVLTPGTIACTYDKESLAHTLRSLEGELADIHEFRGLVTCKGTARGRAKIITHSDHLQKVEEGDIFVAKYTFPTFTPYMVKSAAIVTDEGGLTSHAAIISREYKKPCIVGTHIATQVLKDGDEVEVDAEEGIVRIVSRA
jgi:phosphohistidine swiveling domain-containing protein